MESNLNCNFSYRQLKHKCLTFGIIIQFELKRMVLYTNLINKKYKKMQI